MKKKRKKGRNEKKVGASDSTSDSLVQATQSAPDEADAGSASRLASWQRQRSSSREESGAIAFLFPPLSLSFVLVALACRLAGARTSGHGKRPTKHPLPCWPDAGVHGSDDAEHTARNTAIAASVFIIIIAFVVGV